MNSVTRIKLPPAAAAFDQVAASYDELFTHSAIGRAQRRQVWNRLTAAFRPGDQVLELNCGTGEDARFLAQRGVSVVACDASAGMLEVAKRQIPRESAAPPPKYLHLAIEDLSYFKGKEIFDGAFSNFSGLNCLSDLRPAAQNLAGLVRPGGKVLLCLWGRVCAAEVIWYLCHGQPRKAVRRFAGKAGVKLGQAALSVWYPTIRTLRLAFAPWFRLNARRAVGLFVPPSYAESWVRGCPSMLARLEKLDSACAHWPVLRDAGDHRLLEFMRCNP